MHFTIQTFDAIYGNPIVLALPFFQSGFIALRKTSFIRFTFFMSSHFMYFNVRRDIPLRVVLKLCTYVKNTYKYQLTIKNWFQNRNQINIQYILSL